jgi:hypothetical protein
MENPPPPCWMPSIGMKFNIVDDAWNLWISNSGMVGFDVRKQYNNKSLVDGVYTSSRFVCAKAGLRRKDKRDHLTKNLRAETRTRCKVRMGIMINQVDGNYELYDLVLDHNHVLQVHT